MPTTRTCHGCGATLTDDIPDGSCPVCAFRDALALAESSPEALVTEQAGDRIGHYKLLEQIGEGGCGIVYMAEQVEPIRRRVALKIVKLGMDTKQVIARFEAERQALALMDHPHIARVLDAGATETGRPYFVMELVRGIKITDYCNQHRLSIRERLGLFMEVCSAIQHAHQKGIIHRDIKPSNILVTVLDGVAVPKVIDFGIAKATQQPLTGKTLFTSFQQFIGTPAYMSPEQAELSGVDVDTRSDIYTLGVLLYELLTGHTPFESKKLHEAGFEEMRRLIREEEPTRPSTRLSSLPREDLTTVAKHQRTEPPRLVHLVRGDLDWIVMKCLEKDRARRYETANDLARDVERHLQHEAVLAAAPSTLYRMSKFVRRHRVGLATAAALVLLVLAGVLGVVWQAVRADQLRIEAEQQKGQAEQARMEAERQKVQAEGARQEAEAQSGRARAEKATAEEARQEAERQKVQAEAARQDAETALKKAQTEKERAEKALTAAEAARRATADATARANTASQQSREQRAKVEEIMSFMLGDLSKRLRLIGRADLLDKVTERVLEHYDTLPPGDPSLDSLARRLEAFKNRGLVLAVRGESTKALESYQASLETAKRLLERDQGNSGWQGEIGFCHQKIGELMEVRGDSMQALEEFETSRSIAQGLADQAPSAWQWQEYLLASYIKIGDVQQVQGDATQALVAYQKALEIVRRLAEKNPEADPEEAGWQRALAIVSGKMGVVLLQAGDVEQARSACKRALDIVRILSTNHPGIPQWQMDLARGHDNLGDVYFAARELNKAGEEYEASAAIRSLLAQTDPSNAEWQRDLAQSYANLGRVHSSESNRRQVVEFAWDSRIILGQSFSTVSRHVRRLFSPDTREETALEEVRKSLNAARQMTVKDPANVQYRVALAASQSSMGDVLRLAKKETEALTAYKNALTNWQELASGDTNAVELQYMLAAAHADLAAVLRELSRQDAALQEARSALDTLSLLGMRWPRNFLLLQGTRPGGRNGSAKQPLSPEQLDAVGSVFEPAFNKTRARAAKGSGEPNGQEEWGRYCTEMVMWKRLKGEAAEMLVYADKAAGVWQARWESAPANETMKAELRSAYVLLGVCQLLNGQPQLAINSAQRGLELDPAAIEGKAILVLGHLAAGQSEPGCAILLENRDLKIAPGQTFCEAILDELRRLHDKRLANPDFGKIEKLLASEPGKVPD